MMLTSPLLHADINSDAVLAAERARGVALVERDRAALDSLLADDLRYVHSTGRVQGKSDVLAGFDDGSLAYESFSLDQLVAREITDNVVVVNGEITQRKLSSDGWKDLTLLFQSVWRLDQDTWRMVGLQTLQPPH